MTDAGGRTRLVTGCGFSYPWHRPAGALLSLLLFEVGDSRTHTRAPGEARIYPRHSHSE